MLYYKKIRKLCNERNITLKLLCEKMDISEHGLQGMFKNDTMQVRLLVNIANYFKVPVTYFFEDVPAEKNDKNEIDRAFEALKEMVKERMK